MESVDSEGDQLSPAPKRLKIKHKLGYMEGTWHDYDSWDGSDSDQLSPAPAALLDVEDSTDEMDEEWMKNDDFGEPGQPSGVEVVSPSELEVSLEKLGDAVNKD